MSKEVSWQMRLHVIIPYSHLKNRKQTFGWSASCYEMPKFFHANDKSYNSRSSTVRGIPCRTFSVMIIFRGNNSNANCVLCLYYLHILLLWNYKASIKMLLGGDFWNVLWSVLICWHFKLIIACKLQVVVSFTTL